MNAADQAQLGALLDMGLAHAGLEVVRGEVQAGNVVGWRALSGVEIVGQLLARKLAVRLRAEAPAPAPAAVPGRATNATVLRLLRPGLDEDA